jgi:hypothetical protein
MPTLQDPPGSLQELLERPVPVRDERDYGACPTYFAASCWTARRGGTDGYECAGRNLVGGLGSLAPYDVQDEDWAVKLDELQSLVVAGQDGDILAWFDEWLPRCMALVPARRRQSFLKGVYRYVIEEENAIEM